MTIRNLDAKTGLLTIFILMIAGCSADTEPNPSHSANEQVNADTVHTPVTPIDDDGIHETLTTIPVAAFSPEASEPSTHKNEAVLPSGEFTEEHVTEVFGSGQTRATYQTRFYDGVTIRHGEYREFYEDGTLFSKGNFDNDWKHGRWEFFHPSGQPARVTEYQQGIPSGTWRWFGKEGESFRSAEYVNGVKSGEQITYWPDGQTVKLKENFVNGELDGLVVGFNESGSKVLELNFREGKPNGTETRWFETGAIAATGSYQDGRPDGLFTYYSPEGTKTSEVHWTYGKRTPGFKSSIPSEDGSTSAANQ